MRRLAVPRVLAWVAAPLLCAVGCGWFGGSPPVEPDASQIAQKIADEMDSRVSQVITLTPADSNLLRGHHGFRSVAVINDAGLPDPDAAAPTIAFGTVVEVYDGWSYTAEWRFAQLSRIRNRTPAMPDEYDYDTGIVLLRVNAELPRSVAQQYRHAFAEAVEMRVSR